MFHPLASPRALAAKSAGAVALLLLGACSHIPFVGPKHPNLTPARSSAENLIRIDAALRSGCDTVQNIERPTAPPTSQAPQRWVAHTCTGDISYDVVTTPSPDGPIVKVLPVPGPLNKPANPNAKPALPGQ